MFQNDNLQPKFSKEDLKRVSILQMTDRKTCPGFRQMPLDKASRHLKVPGLGQFEWIVSPVGLRGCPASFQHLEKLAIEVLLM